MFVAMVETMFAGWATGIALSILIHLLGWAAATVKLFGREGL